MKTSIKLLLSAAVLAASSSAAFGQTLINGTLTADSPRFARAYSFDPGEPCELTEDGQVYHYAAYSAYHAGGQLTIQSSSSDYDSYLGLYADTFNPSSACQNAVEYDDDGAGYPTSGITRNFPAGTYIIVTTTISRGSVGSYILTTNATNVVPWVPPATTATPVPVAGIPALALGSLALIGAAGFVSRRRKAKAEKA